MKLTLWAARKTLTSLALQIRTFLRGLHQRPLQIMRRQKHHLVRCQHSGFFNKSSHQGLNSPESSGKAGCKKQTQLYAHVTLPRSPAPFDMLHISNDFFPRRRRSLKSGSCRSRSISKLAWSTPPATRILSLCAGKHRGLSTLPAPARADADCLIHPYSQFLQEPWVDNRSPGAQMERCCGSERRREFSDDFTGGRSRPGQLDL